jgi:hypothetical protein
MVNTYYRLDFNPRRQTVNSYLQDTPYHTTQNEIHAKRHKHFPQDILPHLHIETLL